MDKAREKTRVALYSVLVGIFLAGLKLVVGLITGSLGILSEALHSLLDLGAAIITFFSVRISIRPPDETHPYGHGKVENISALAQALLLLATCLWIVYEALQRLLGKDIVVDASLWAFGVMGISILLDIVISRVLKRAAKRYSSQALEADALHYSSDILSSGVVILGLAGVRLGFPALDPVAALGVALLVSIASIRLGTRAISELLDRAPKGLSEKIMKYLLTLKDVKTVERIRIRRSGASTFVDIVVSAGRLLSLDKSHELADRIEAGVQSIVPESDILVHFHPSSNGESFIETFRALALKCCPQIQDIHNIQSYRDSENGRYFVSLHVRLDPSLSLETAHELIDTLETGLKEALPQLGTVETHIETTESVGSGKKVEVPQDKLRVLKEAILKDDRIKGIHDVFLHRSTQGSMISCHVQASRQLSLEEAHQVATFVEEKTKEIFPEAAEVIVHTEPPD